MSEARGPGHVLAEAFFGGGSDGPVVLALALTAPTAASGFAGGRRIDVLEVPDPADDVEARLDGAGVALVRGQRCWVRASGLAPPLWTARAITDGLVVVVLAWGPWSLPPRESDDLLLAALDGRGVIGSVRLGR